MEKIIDVKELPSRKFLTRTQGGHSIYLLENGLKYKRYGDLTPEQEKSLKEQLSEDSCIFSFPKQLVEAEEKIVGVISTYEQGIELESIPEDVNINDLLNKVLKAEFEISRLSMKGWRLLDIHGNNIIVGTNPLTFRIIDTDYYVKRTNKDYKTLVRENRMELITALIFNIIPKLPVSSIMKDKKMNKEYLLAINGYISPTEYLVSILDKLKKHNEITDIKSLRKSLL